MPSGLTPERKKTLSIAAMWLLAIVASWVVVQWRKAPSARVNVTRQPPPALSQSKAMGPLMRRAPNQYRLDARHTGQSTSVGPARGVSRWTRDLGARVTGQPVVDKTGNVFVGTHDGTVWALNSEGITMWKRDLGAPIFAAPLIDDAGNLYVGTDGRGFVGLDPQGTTRFVIQTPEDADTAASFAPDGTLRFASGQQLYAIDTAGHLLWTFQAGDKIFTSPSMDDTSTAYFGAQDDYVYAVDAQGHQRFRYKTGGDVDVSPLLDRDVLYVGTDDQHVYCISLDGALRWATRLEGYVRGALALGAQDTLIATHSGPRGALVGLDRATGVKRFRFAFTLTDSTDTGVRGGALVDADGTIYVGSDDDYLYALSKDGQLRWAMATGSDVEASTALAADGTLYVASAKGLLHAVGGNE